MMICHAAILGRQREQATRLFALFWCECKTFKKKKKRKESGQQNKEYVAVFALVNS